MMTPISNRSRLWSSVLILLGILGLAASPHSEAEDRQKDAIINLLGSETRPAQSLLPTEISVQSEFVPGAGVPIGKVQLREGDPIVIHQGESVAYLLKKDRSIFTGDTIITEQDARVNLIMDDKSVLAIAPYSKLIIDESVYDPDTETRSSTLRLLFGRIRSIVAKIEGEPNYWIQTPTAVAGVRGSDFGVATTGNRSAVVTTEKTDIDWDGAVVTQCVVAGADSGINLASGSADHTVRLWNANSGEQVALIDAHTGPVTAVAFSPDGEILASGSADRTVRLWNVDTGEQLTVLEGASAAVSSVAFSPDGKTVAAGSADNTARIWSVNSGRQLSLLPGHSGPVSSVAFSPDGKTVATGSADNTIRLWDVKSGEQTALFEGHSGSVSSVAFSPDGKTLASGAVDQTIRLWDPGSGQQLALIENGGVPVYSVAFSSDGNTLVAGSADKTVRMWNVRERGQPVRLKSDSDHAYSVAISPNDATVAAGSEDRSIHLWNIASGQESVQLAGHERAVLSVDFRPGITDSIAGAYPVSCEEAAALAESMGPNLGAVALLGMPPEFD